MMKSLVNKQWRMSHERHTCTHFFRKFKAKQSIILQLFSNWFWVATILDENKQTNLYPSCDISLQTKQKHEKQNPLNIWAFVIIMPTNKHFVKRLTNSGKWMCNTSCLNCERVTMVSLRTTVAIGLSFRCAPRRNSTHTAYRSTLRTVFWYAKKRFIYVHNLWRLLLFIELPFNVLLLRLETMQYFFVPFPFLDRTKYGINGKQSTKQRPILGH